jgi:hypothetical protein
VSLVPAVRKVALETAGRYKIVRPFWSWWERVFRVYTMDDQLIMLVKRPIFRLRERMTVWADEAETRPVMHLAARQIIAINVVYDVVDPDGGVLGSVERRGLRGIFRDRFVIRDAHDAEIGMMEEEGAALLRRFFPWLTSRHVVLVGGQPVALVRQIFRFFTKEFEVELRPSGLDPRFVMACAMLALLAESHREQR